jgi:fibrillarin-like rRNA methylase
MDYAKVREDQQTAVLEWEMTHFRTEEHRVKIPVLAGSEDVSEPNERLLKRSVSSLSCHRKVYND